MGILRILLVIVLLFSGYVSAAHASSVCGAGEIASMADCCDPPGEEGGCSEDSCSGCLVQAAVVAAMIIPSVFTKPALEALPAQKLARDALAFQLRPPDMPA